MEKNVCATCRERLPSSQDDQLQKKETPKTVQCDENFMKILYKNTGITLNDAKTCKKELCQKCYMKILAFDEFRDTALCCATALHELLLEEEFSIKKLNNLKYFCCTCLTKLQTLSKTTSQLKNIAWKGWLEECIALKERTAIEQWPGYVCDACCARINEFIEFEQLAKETFKQIEIENEEENNKEYGIAAKEIEKKETSKIESANDQSYIIIENVIEDDQGGTAHRKESNETDELLAEEQIANTHAFEKEYDLNETSDIFENTRKWVEKTTANVRIHCKKKRKQRSRRKKAASTTLESLGSTLNTLSEISGMEVSAIECNNFQENVDISPKNGMELGDAEIAEEGVPNNELMPAISRELVESHTIIETIVDEEREKSTNITSEIQQIIDTNSLEDVPMSANISTANNNKQSYSLIAEDIFSNPAKIGITHENSADITNTIIEYVENKNEETEIPEDDISNKIRLPTIESMSSNDLPTCYEPTSSSILIQGHTPNDQKRKNSDAKITENKTFKQKSAKQNISKVTNKRVKSKKLAKPNKIVEIRIGTNTPTANTGKETEPSATAILDDILLHQQASASNIVNNEPAPTTLPQQDIVVERATDVCTTFEEEEKIQNNGDFENSDEVNTCQKSSTNDTAVKKVKTKKAAQPNTLAERPRDTSALMENAGLQTEQSATAMLEDIALQQTSLKNIVNNGSTSAKLPQQDIIVERSTDMCPTFVEEIVLKNNSDAENCDDAISSQTSSANNNAVTTKNKPALKRPSKRVSFAKNQTDANLTDVVMDAEENKAEVSADIIPTQPSQTKNQTISNVANKKRKQKNSAKPNTIVKRPVDTGSAIENTGLETEQSVTAILDDIALHQQISLKNIVNNESTSKKLPQIDIIIERSTDVCTTFVEEIKLQNNGDFGNSGNAIPCQTSSTMNTAVTTKTEPALKKPSKQVTFTQIETDANFANVADVVVDAEESKAEDSTDIFPNQPSQTNKQTFSNITNKKNKSKKSVKLNTLLERPIGTYTPIENYGLQAEQSVTAMLDDIALQQQVAATNIVNNEPTSSMLSQQDILVERSIDVCTKFVEEITLENNCDVENTDDAITCQASSTNNTVVTTKNKPTLKKPSRTVTFSEESKAEVSPNIIAAQIPTNIEGIHVVQGVDLEYNSEDAISCQTSSTKIITKATKNKQKLANNNNETKSVLDDVFLSVAENSTNDASKKLVNGKKRHSEILEYANNEANPSKHIGNSNKKVPTKKKPKQDILPKSNTDINSIQVEDIKQTEECAILNKRSSKKFITKAARKQLYSKKPAITEAAVENLADPALILEEDRQEERNDVAESFVEANLNQPVSENNIVEALVNESISNYSLTRDILTDIDSTHVDDADRRPEVTTIREDCTLEHAYCETESSVDAITNQQSSTNNILEACNNYITSNIPSNGYLSAESTSDTTMHMVDVVVKMDNVDSVISAGFILKQPSHTTKNSKRERSIENLKDNNSVQVEQANVYANITEDAILNETNPTKSIGNRQKNKSTAKMKSMPIVNAESDRDVAMNIETEVLENESTEAGTYLGVKLSEASLTNNIEETTTNTLSNLDISVESSPNIDNTHLEDIVLNGGEIMNENNGGISEITINNDPGTKKNMSKESNIKLKSKKKSQRRAISAEQPKDIGSKQVEDDERTNRVSNTKITRENSPIPGVPGKTPSDVTLPREHEWLKETNCEAINSVDDINEQNFTNNAVGPSNNNATEVNISDGNPTDFDSMHEEDFPVKGDQIFPNTSPESPSYVALTTEDEGLENKNTKPELFEGAANQLSPGNNIAEPQYDNSATLNIIPDENPTDFDSMHEEDFPVKGDQIYPNTSPESPSYVALTTEDEGLEKKNTKPEWFEGPANQLSPANNIAEPPYDNSATLNNITTENPTLVDSMHEEDFPIKGDQIYANTSPESPSYVALTTDDEGIKEKNSKAERFEGAANQLSPANNITEPPYNNSATLNNISPENPRHVDSMLVDDFPMKGDQIYPNISPESPSYVALTTDDEGLEEKNSEPESFEGAANQLSSVDNIAEPSYDNSATLNNISAENLRHVDSMHVKDVQLQSEEIDLEITTTDNLQHSTSAKSVETKASGKLTSKKAAKQDSFDERPTQIDFRHEYNGEFDVKKNYPVNAINSSMDNTKTTDREPSKLESLVDKIAENTKTNQAKSIGKTKFNQPTPTMPDTSVGQSIEIDSSNSEEEGEISDTDISKEATFTQSSSRKNLEKVSKTKKSSKKSSKRAASAESLTHVDTTRARKVERKGEASDMYTFETDFHKKKSKTYTNSKKYKYKSTSESSQSTSRSRSPERLIYYAKEPKEQYRSKKHKLPKSDILFRSHSASSSRYTAYDEERERGRYTTSSADPYSDRQRSTSSYSKWSSSYTKSGTYGDASMAVDPHFSAEARYYRRDPVSYTQTFRNPNVSRHYSMPRPTYDIHERSRSTFVPYSRPKNPYQCLACLKSFKRSDYLTNHIRFTAQCSKIVQERTGHRV